jgi:hypothetical protein
MIKRMVTRLNCILYGHEYTYKRKISGHYPENVYECISCGKLRKI